MTWASVWASCCLGLGPSLALIRSYDLKHEGYSTGSIDLLGARYMGCSNPTKRQPTKCPDTQNLVA